MQYESWPTDMYINKFDPVNIRFSEFFDPGRPVTGSGFIT